MRTWIALLAALAATACSKPEAAPDAAAQATSPSAVVQAWTLAGGETGHTALTYAAPGRAAQLSLGCADGSGKLEFTAPLQDQASIDQPVGGKWLHTFMVETREEVQPYPADAEKADMGPVATALGNVDDPAFVAFAASGEISVDGHDASARTPAEQAAVRQFFKVCAETP